MKQILKPLCLVLVGVLLLCSCGPRPQYKTAKGKKKLKYYNSIQYGKTQPKSFKRQK